MSTRYPLPCVRTVGGGRYAAYVTVGRRHRYSGTYSIAEAARATVLRAEAEQLEAKAARYRTEADALILLSGLKLPSG